MTDFVNQCDIFVDHVFNVDTYSAYLDMSAPVYNEDKREIEAMTDEQIVELHKMYYSQKRKIYAKSLRIIKKALKYYKCHDDSIVNHKYLTESVAKTALSIILEITKKADIAFFDAINTPKSSLELNLPVLYEIIQDVDVSLKHIINNIKICGIERNLRRTMFMSRNTNPLHLNAHNKSITSTRKAPRSGITGHVLPKRSTLVRKSFMPTRKSARIALSKTLLTQKILNKKTK